MKRQQIAFMASKDDSGMTTDEKLASLFQPDTLLSTQYFDNLRRKTLLEPEKRLMLAVLEDAIHSFQDNLFAEAVGKKTLFDEVEQWILERDGDWIFSFDNVCEALGFTPDYVRQGLLRWEEKQKSKRSELQWTRKKLAG